MLRCFESKNILKSAAFDCFKFKNICLDLKQSTGKFKIRQITIGKAFLICTLKPGHLATVVHATGGIGHQLLLSRSIGRGLSFIARTYLQLPLRQWGAGNVYLLVFSR